MPLSRAACHTNAGIMLRVPSAGSLIGVHASKLPPPTFVRRGALAITTLAWWDDRNLQTELCPYPADCEADSISSCLTAVPQQVLHVL